MPDCDKFASSFRFANAMKLFCNRRAFRLSTKKCYKPGVVSQLQEKIERMARRRKSLRKTLSRYSGGTALVPWCHLTAHRIVCGMKADGYKSIKNYVHELKAFHLECDYQWSEKHARELRMMIRNSEYLKGARKQAQALSLQRNAEAFALGWCRR